MCVIKHTAVQWIKTNLELIHDKNVLKPLQPPPHHNKGFMHIGQPILYPLEDCQIQPLPWSMEALVCFYLSTKISHLQMEASK